MVGRIPCQEWKGYVDGLLTLQQTKDSGIRNGRTVGHMKGISVIKVKKIVVLPKTKLGEGI